MADTSKMLSDDEIYLRITVPNFFEELVGRHGATLMDQGNPETFVSWKQYRDQCDREFMAHSSDHLIDVLAHRRSQSIEMQSVEFSAALTRFASQASIRLKDYDLSPEQAVEAYDRVISEEIEAELEGMPLIDPEIVGNRETQQTPNAPSDKIVNPSLTPEQIEAARKEQRDELEQGGKAAKDAQEQSLQKKIDPLKRGR